MHTYWFLLMNCNDNISSNINSKVIVSLRVPRDRLTYVQRRINKQTKSQHKHNLNDDCHECNHCLLKYVIAYSESCLRVVTNVL